MIKENLEKEIIKLIPDEHKGEIIGRELFFKCPNPDHDDNNYTNCSINLDTGLFHCFACGFSGNLKRLKQLLGKNHANKYEVDPLTGKKIVSRSTFTWR